ncbi:AbrB/MazE/SpoVT family DNA-binding domain-containing protein [Acetobacteraceae bacterium H6797]|nr:AbrB/MazE/SpoVT family DNA-binding domain-containing protein [Acetobacteraceae bacterium H6797]
MAGALPALIDPRGRLRLPRPLREAMGLKPGALLLLRLTPSGLEMAAPEALLKRQREARLALQALS